MSEQILLWNDPEWASGAREWIVDAMRQAGKPVTGQIEQPYVRPWSTVMTVPSADGLYYFKADMPAFAFEPRLVQALAAACPDCMPEVAAVDLERGWMITRDAGTPLRSRLKTPEDLRLLDPVLPRLAELQMAWASREAELLALGVPDHRLERLPGLFKQLAVDRHALMIGEADWLSEEQYQELQTTLPRYAAICAQLLEAPIPQSIHFDDMHSNNIFLREQAGRPARFTFQDWGDSSVSHPFCSLLIFLRATSDLMGLPDDATEKPERMPPMLARLRDLYLEPWQKFAPQADLVKIFNLAWRAGMVSRALAWHESNQSLPEWTRAEYRYTVPAWLSDFLLAMRE